MSKLGALIYLLTGPTVAGILMIVLLNIPGIKNGTLIAGTLFGFVLAIPIAWALTRKLSANIRF